MVSLGQQITNEQIAEMIREADVDGDGKINFVGMFSYNKIISLFLTTVLYFKFRL